MTNSSRPVSPGPVIPARVLRAIALALSLAFGLSGCAGKSGAALDPADRQTLAPCPPTPNCVSSDATDSLHRIEPLALGSDLHAEWQALLAYLDNTASFTVKVQDDTYVRAEARTKVFGFVDDVQFQMRPEQGFIAMRSASRLGLSDLGANRRRLEAIRQALEQPAGGS